MYIKILTTMIIFYVLLTFLTDSVQSELNDTTIYRGNRLDLIDQSGWILLKETNLTLNDIKKVINTNQDIWELKKNFAVRDLEEKVFMQIRGNFSALSVYINDSLFVKNGNFDKSGKIISPAKMQLIERIPDKFLNQDINSLKLIFSTHNIQGSFWIEDIALNSKSILSEREPNYVFQPLFIAGFLFLAIGINVALFFAFGRQRVFVFLALYFLCGFLSSLGQVFYWWCNPSIFLSIYIQHILSFLSQIEKILLLFVLLHQYQFNKKTKQIILGIGAFYFLVSIYILHFETLVLLIYIGTVSLFAYFRKYQNSGLITSALIVLILSGYICDGCIINQYTMIKNNIFFKLTFSYIDRLAILYFAIVMLYMVTKQIYQHNVALDKSRLKSSKLESQLLKKHIQPHFLMNSLMSLQELIDEDKEKASAMVDALSKEFHSLSKMSSKKIVFMKDELDICNTHLEIMGHQQDAKFTLKTIGINGGELIPPAVIHTLIENGITHGYSGMQNGYFELSKIVSDNTIEYRLFNDGKPLKQKNSIGSGTGLKYIESRLEESYKGRWELISQPTKDGWESIIRIRENK